MVGLAENDVFFVADDEDDEFLRDKIFLGDAKDVVFGNGLQAATHLLPVIRFFGVAAREFVLGESIGDLGFGGEGVGKTVNESAPRSVQFVIGDRCAGDLLEFLE